MDEIKKRNSQYHSLDPTDPPPSNNSSKVKEYTSDDIINMCGFGLFQYKISAFAGLSWIADSMEIMVISILGPILSCDWKISHFQEALITTFVFIGFLIGSPILGFICDKFGRKIGLLMTSSIAFYFGIITPAAPNYKWFIILRFLVGIGISGTPQAITYYSEFLPTKSRGKSIMIIEIFFALGGIFEVLLGYLIIPRLGWRPWIALSAVPLIPFIIIMGIYPESPRYDIASGNTKRAKRTLLEIAKENKIVLPDFKLKSITNFSNNIDSIMEIFSVEHRLTSVMLFFIWFGCGFTYYGIALFSSELLSMGGTCMGKVAADECQCKVFSTWDYIALMITAASELPALLFVMLLIDKIGRKLSLCLSFAISCVAMLLLTICMPKIPMVGLLFIGRGFISAGFQVAYVYTPEYYPTTCRASALGICSGFSRLGAIITPFFAQVLLSHSVIVAVSLFGVLCFAIAVVSILLRTETKGCPLIEH